MKNLSLLLAVGTLMFAGTALADHPSSNQALHLNDDVVRDGNADILFRGGTALAYWEMSSTGANSEMRSSAYAGDAGPGYTVVAVSDFDGEGSADVLWTNGSHLKLWINNGFGNYTPVTVGTYSGGWQPFAAGDINGDGRSDLFFRGATHLAYWLMDGPSVMSSGYAGDGGPGYRVVAIKNFSGNQDGTVVDVLWANGAQLKMWTNGVGAGGPVGSFYPLIFGSYGGGWEPFAAGDVNGDGTTDILFRGGTHIAYWSLLYVDDFFPFWIFESKYAGDGGAGFRAIAVSHYDDDRSADILWTNGSQLKIWNDNCGAWDYDCPPHDYVPHIIGTYGGGWEPLEMLIPAN